MTNAPDAPPRLRRQWTALLLAPVAWTVALGVLFMLTEDACARGSRTALWVVAGVCILAAAAGAPLAWQLRKGGAHEGPDDRARFMMDVALGLSAIFTVVIVLTAVPLLMLGACRT